MSDVVLDIARKARKASSFIATAPTEQKNKVLRDIAQALVTESDFIVEKNRQDVSRSKKEGISDSLLDRLMLDQGRIAKIAGSINQVIDYNDPVGEVIFGYNLPNGLTLNNIRVPLGVIGIIYEARPNVTVDAAVLCLKAGSCVILRGSSSAIDTNMALVEIMRGVLAKNDFPPDIIQIIPTSHREDAVKLMQAREYVDVLIPRGGKQLIDSVVANSKVPVIETGVGNCHIYVDSQLEGIEYKTIEDIVVNSKTQRPSVCNAAEKLLIHSRIAGDLLPRLASRLEDLKVELVGCDKARQIYPSLTLADQQDWYTEYLELKMGIKVVDSLEEAVNHINQYGSHHTDAIITSSYNNSSYFAKAVDSSTVNINASTRFTDGGEFGMGAEVGISTQKLHHRGPMGLREITTNKFLIYGNGQIRK
ncbi:MAG: glutamate-5-semialdehyde dehydrogenase [Actinomycetia bacterium]|nr:glutamate-5-semialdehyde dehydrogenase [Actinomycetes bacterium]